MKKILVLLSLSLMLTNVPFISRLWAIELLPSLPLGEFKIECRVVVDGTEYMVVEVDGKKYYVKVQS